MPKYTSLQIGTLGMSLHGAYGSLTDTPGDVVDDVLAVKPVGAQLTCGSYNGTKSPYL